MSEFPASSCCIIDYLYLVEVNADSSLPILSEICQKFSMLIDEVLMRVCSRLCGICWLCLIAILSWCDQDVVGRCGRDVKLNFLIFRDRAFFWREVQCASRDTRLNDHLWSLSIATGTPFDRLRSRFQRDTLSLS